MENKDDYVELPVTGGYVTKVDPDIGEKLKGIPLHLRYKKRFHKYVSFYLNGSHIDIHRFILNFPENKVADHINGDTLDNRRINLRAVDYALNTLNCHQKPKNKNGFFSVYDNVKSKLHPWRVRIWCKNQSIDKGYYVNKYIAAIFRDLAIERIYGLNVGLNYNYKIPFNELCDFFERTKGRIFKIVFVKRNDGSCREMICRTGVSKYINGKGMAFEPSEKNLLTVYELKSKSYKCIPLENVICLTFAKKNYLVTRPRLNIAA